MKKFLILMSTILLLTACASGPTILSNVSPGTDFRQFETYGFMSPLGTDRRGGVQTPLSARLMDSMSREMAARGLTASDNPDLLIDFLVQTEERLDVRQTPTNTVHRSHWGPHWGTGFTTWPTYQTTVRQFTEGTLIIDLIDPKAKALVAEGGAQSRISSNQEFTQQEIDDVVGQVMAGIWAN